MHKPGFAGRLPEVWKVPLRNPRFTGRDGMLAELRRQRADRRASDGWPSWTSPARPGREHDTTALRAHPEALPLLAEWTDEGHAVLGELGYELTAQRLAAATVDLADRRVRQPDLPRGEALTAVFRQLVGWGSRRGRTSRRHRLR
jgi:hypothetical protein